MNDYILLLILLKSIYLTFFIKAKYNILLLAKEKKKNKN